MIVEKHPLALKRSLLSLDLPLICQNACIAIYVFIPALRSVFIWWEDLMRISMRLTMSSASTAEMD